MAPNVDVSLGSWFARRAAGPRIVGGRSIPPEMRVVSFVAGCLDRVRGFDRFFEIGPGRVLAGLLKRVQRKVDCQNITA